MLLREKKLPMSLLEDPEQPGSGKAARVHLLSTQVRFFQATCVYGYSHKPDCVGSRLCLKSNLGINCAAASMSPSAV